MDDRPHPHDAEPLLHEAVALREGVGQEHVVVQLQQPPLVLHLPAEGCRVDAVAVEGLRYEAHPLGGPDRVVRECDVLAHHLAEGEAVGFYEGAPVEHGPRGYRQEVQGLGVEGGLAGHGDDLVAVLHMPAGVVGEQEVADGDVRGCIVGGGDHPLQEMRGWEVVHVQEPYQLPLGCDEAQVLGAAEPAGAVLDDEPGIGAPGADVLHGFQGAVDGAGVYHEDQLEIAEGLAVDVIDEAWKVGVAVVDAGHYRDLRLIPSAHMRWIGEVLFDVGDIYS